MLDNLLIVFSNYNGMRTKNDLSSPRILMTIDSFKQKVDNWKELNVLLLDNNSNDGSDELMEYIVGESGNKWIYKKKYKEDYYLGTLCHLLHDCKGKYKYLMVVDNDQYFIRSGFLQTVINILNKNKEIVCVQIQETTEADSLDAYKTSMGLGGFFDQVNIENDEIWLRSFDFREPVKELDSIPRRRGVGHVRIPGKRAKRVCWSWYSFCNVIVNINKFVPIFEVERLQLPYKNNKDRLALFAATVRDVGRTAYLGMGASINIGHRNNLNPKYKLRELIKKYNKPHKSWWVDDERSFFVRNGQFCSIEKEIENVKKERDLSNMRKSPARYL